MFNLVTKGLSPAGAKDVWENYLCKGKSRADWERERGEEGYPDNADPVHYPEGED